MKIIYRLLVNLVNSNFGMHMNIIILYYLIVILVKMCM